MISLIELGKIKCPRCIEDSSITKLTDNSYTCLNCSSIYPGDKNYIDFIQPNLLDDIGKEAILTWGEDLHIKEGHLKHYLGSHMDIIRNRLGRYFEEIEGDVLEAGFGIGADLVALANNPKVYSITGIDIGINAKKVANKYQNIEKLSVFRGDIQSLPFPPSRFDCIYSYGVIHHTKNPLLAAVELRRVLKDSGLAFLYVYSSHSKNFLKRFGVLIETIIINSISSFPRRLKLSICLLLTPLCWLSFTVPSFIFRSLGFYSFANKIPLNWGTTPYSILGDIKDRLLAPVNHRYSKQTFELLLNKAGLKCLDIIEDSSGIYVVATTL